MHEFGLTQGILDIAVQHAESNGASTILKINVRAGDMMAIVEDSMQFSFEFLSKDTIADGAALVIERVPIVLSCGACGAQSHVGQFEVYSCPQCGSPAVTLASGREFYVDSIEIE